ncbi:MAG TPA: hypothetical protein VK203_23705 [Nostocaceae cyanobacterium]|nr:hypothetical protein [Nostocaceae cyanobacterium]
MEKYKFWTEKGLSDLGRRYREQRQSKGYSIDDVVEIIRQKTGKYVSARAIGNIEGCKTEKPNFNTIVALAASEIITDQHGKPLSIYDFIDIASETYKSDDSKKVNHSRDKEMERLICLIKDYMRQEQINEAEFARRCLLPVKIINDILAGRLQDQGELTEQLQFGLLATVLTNPLTGQRFSNEGWIGLMKYCGFEVADTINAPSQERGNELNGVH